MIVSFVSFFINPKTNNIRRAKETFRIACILLTFVTETKEMFEREVEDCCQVQFLTMLITGYIMPGPPLSFDTSQEQKT